ncbi:TetR/AcrR family transcriptional regulator [Streptomyces scopuliridis]|uniref:TetR/AcrR family transcriptional regulator n=1 Tax=Streptomyces scopuliridis TaxID=452529 RepID=UPI002DD9484A|nr:TetR/AcrR family transcriptional regulator [Streptomyces scopuliridis]WSB35350.1 TetR/AcrR family transcriptional regulator [Streptomyces scopuliridis]
MSKQNGRQDPAEAAGRKDEPQRDTVTIQDSADQQWDQCSEGRKGDEIPKGRADRCRWRRSNVARVTKTEQGSVPRRGTTTRDRLYEAAAALFVERGYEATTMADIAERAGTSRRTAFNHFPSKNDIPMLWTRKLADTAVAEATDASDEVPERIRAYLHLISEMVQAEPELSRQMMLGWTAAVGPIRYESQLLTDLAPLLREGQAHGQVDPGVDVDVAARTLSDTLMGATLRWVRERDRLLQDMVDEGVELILTAVRPRS